MKQFIILFHIIVIQVAASNAQQLAQGGVGMSVDLQPILQLTTITSPDIRFEFTEPAQYYKGLTQYGATTLKVTSTVNWDLYAVAASSGNVGQGYWDLQASYGAQNGQFVNRIPLSALELHQNTPNNYASAATGVYKDYSAPFPPVSSPSGSNSIYVDPANCGAPPSSEHKYIAGHSGITGIGADGVAGGSYKTPDAASSFYYTLDYRIVPGLPVTFPMAYDASGTTSQNLTVAEGGQPQLQPGVYTMQIQFVLLEDQ